MSVKLIIRKSAIYRRLHLFYIYMRTKKILPKWKNILKINKTSDIAANSNNLSKKILIATGSAGHVSSMTIESLLGVSILKRGFPVEFLVCDAALPACIMCEINWYSNLERFYKNGPIDRCKSCYKPSQFMLEEAGLDYIGLSRALTDWEIKYSSDFSKSISFSDISCFSLGGVSLGEHAMAGALRFFARGDLDRTEYAELILRRYLESALLTYFACSRIFTDSSYHVVVVNHGIYVPQGIIAETARQNGIRVVTWHPAYRRKCFIFNHEVTYHKGLMMEPVSVWQDMKWTYDQMNSTMKYLRSRWVGNNDWIRFHHNPIFDLRDIAEEIGIDFLKPTIGLLTNVVWDAQLHYDTNVFSGMIDWIIKTIDYFSARNDLQLLIRIHPAELTGNIPSRQLIQEEINKHFPNLPDNIFIIPAHSNISTYAAMSNCNSVIIYGTKMGVELSAAGLPVIVAGEAWIKNKGITYDAQNASHYFRILDQLPFANKNNSQSQERALKYAYHFFFRRMIPLECIEESKGFPPFHIKVNRLGDLGPGQMKGLDVICDGILYGSEFIYPHENQENVAELI